MMMETVTTRTLCFLIASPVTTIAAERTWSFVMRMWNMLKPMPGLRPVTFSAAPACITRPFACAGTTTIKSTTELFGTLEMNIGLLDWWMMLGDSGVAERIAGGSHHLRAGVLRLSGCKG